MDKSKISTYGKHYSEKGLGQKIVTLPDSTKTKLLKKVATLYAILTEPDVPVWVKASIIGAFGYFICPVDVIPDVIPIVGFLDDIAVMGFILVELSAYDSSSVQTRAEELLAKWNVSDAVKSLQ